MFLNMLHLSVAKCGTSLKSTGQSREVVNYLMIIAIKDY